DQKWYNHIVHGVRTTRYDDSIKAMVCLRSEIESFNPDVNLITNPRWLRKPEDRVEKAASSVSIIVKSEEMAKRCMQKGLNINMQKLEVVRFVRNRQDQQCSTCQKFGHHYLRCTAKQPACRLYGASHKTVDHKCDKCNTKGKRCEHLTPYCANYQTAGHTASDNACLYRKTI
ncbi:hypothetical protein BJ508DRAFT_193056, partial [Ascobolus immersus RN42]